MSILVAIPAVALANDTSWGGKGASPAPVSSAEIEMVAERITIRGAGLNRTTPAGEWRVRCEFTFRSHARTPTTVEMAFPFEANSEMEGLDVSAPPGEKLTPTSEGRPMVWSFKNWVRGKRVPARRIPFKGYGGAFAWRVIFAPGEVVKIVHTYRLGDTSGVGRPHLVEYVLKTGGFWRGGTIQHSHIEVHPGIPFYLCGEAKKVFPHRRIDPVVVDPQEKTTPGGWQTRGKGTQRYLVWDLKQFRPKQDLYVCFGTPKAISKKR